MRSSEGKFVSIKNKTIKLNLRIFVTGIKIIERIDINNWR